MPVPTPLTAADEQIADGTLVIAYPSTRDTPGVLTRVRGPVWQVGSTPVVRVEGYAGGIALDHLDVLPVPLDHVDVVMTRLPHPDGEFVELEDSRGCGIGPARGTEWVDRGDGFAVLRIPVGVL